MKQRMKEFLRINTNKGVETMTLIEKIEEAKENEGGRACDLMESAIKDLFEMFAVEYVSMGNKEHLKQAIEGIAKEALERATENNYIKNY